MKEFISVVCVCACSVASDSYDTMDCSLPGSSGIFQVRILEWVAISYSKGSSQPRDRTSISMSPALAGKFFTAVPPQEVFNTSTKLHPLQLLPL